MSLTSLERRADAAATPVGETRSRSTPATLRLFSVSLTALVVLFAVAAILTVAHRETQVQTSQGLTEPLVVDSQTAYTALSDADTTVAGAILAGPIEPSALRQRYDVDIARASTAVTDAIGRARGSSVQAPLRTLAVGIPFYTAVVAQAATDNRLGYPVAANYLGEASAYLRTTLLGAAQASYTEELARLRSEQSAATSPAAAWLVVLLLAATLVTLVVVQRWVRARFHRQANVGLLAATILLAVAGGWLAVALVAQSGAVTRASTTGTAALTRYTQDRLFGLRLRADEELTLVTRGTVPSYQVDLDAVLGHLRAGLLGGGDGPARADLAAVAAQHQAIAAQTGRGEYTAAIAVAEGLGGGGLPAAAAQLDAALVSRVDTAQSRFEASTSAAAMDLRGLRWVVGVLAGLTLAAGLVGLRARAQEYR